MLVRVFRLSVEVLFLLLTTVPRPSEGANILGLYSAYSQSHLILHMSTAKVLAEAGHNVTVVSMIEPKVKCKDIHLIVIPVTTEQELIIEAHMNKYANKKNSLLDSLSDLFNDMKIFIDLQYELLSHPKFLQIYETRFDLMIVGSAFNDFQFGVAARLGVPVIVEWVTAPSITINTLIGNPAEVSYVHNLLASLSKNDFMGFGNRFKNMVSHLLALYINGQFQEILTNYYKEHFGEENQFPTLSEMRRNVSLVFVNCHLISEGPIRPLVPATIEIGGIQIKDSPDPLPKDIDEFLTSSKYGVILFSLGTNIKSSAVKPEITQIIFNVLSTLKQNVIWKWEDFDHFPGNSSNILYKQWLPQDDILAHPKTKLFVTHAGKGGITEAQYHAVPMVALPVFTDQPGNAAKMQDSGYGLSLDLLTLTEENFGAAIREVLEDEKYAQNVEKFSVLYRDRPLTARQQVVYWTDYVLRHRGAPHLQSPVIHMSTIAAFNLDIYAVLITILIISVLLTCLMVKFAFRKIFNVVLKKNNLKKLKKQ